MILFKAADFPKKKRTWKWRAKEMAWKFWFRSMALCYKAAYHTGRMSVWNEREYARVQKRVNP